MSDERPRRSWRELDRQRDSSHHRRDEVPPSSTPRRERSQKSYRAALDRMFETGKVARLLEPSHPAQAAPDESKYVELLRRVRIAEGRDAITSALDAYLETHELPDDFDILSKALEHRTSPVRLAALQRLHRLIEHTRPRRTRGLIGQLKLLRDAGADEQVAQMAHQIIEQLEA